VGLRVSGLGSRVDHTQELTTPPKPGVGFLFVEGLRHIAPYRRSGVELHSGLRRDVCRLQDTFPL
jgi:hypothetical protein